MKSPTTSRTGRPSLRAARVALAGLAAVAAGIGAEGSRAPDVAMIRAAAPAKPPVDAPPPVIEPGDEQKAVALYQDVFGEQDTAATRASAPAVQLAFARRLVEAATLSGENPALVRHLRMRALHFAAADDAGLPLAMELVGLRLADPDALAKPAVRAGLLETKVRVLERVTALSDAASRKAVVAELVNAAIEAAALHAAIGNVEAGTALLARARQAFGRHGAGDAVVGTALTAAETSHAEVRADAARLAAARRTLLAKPDDAEAASVAGLEDALAAASGKADDKARQELTSAASRLLAKSGDARLRALGAKLGDPAGPLPAVADAWRAAAGATGSGRIRRRVLHVAGGLYRQVLAAEPRHPDALRMRLLIKQITDEVGPLPPSEEAGSVPAVAAGPSVTKLPESPKAKVAGPAAKRVHLEEVIRFRTKDPPVTAELSPDGRLLAVAEDSRRVAVHAVVDGPAGKAGKEVALLADPGDVVTHLAWSPKSNALAVGLRDAAPKIWHPLDPAATAPAVKTHHKPPLQGMAFSSDGRWFSCKCGMEFAKFWPVFDGDTTHPKSFADRGALTGIPTMRHLRFRPGTAIVALVGDGPREDPGGTLILYDNDPTVARPTKSVAFSDPLTRVAFSADGAHVAAGDSRGTVYYLSSTDPHAAGATLRCSKAREPIQGLELLAGEGEIVALVEGKIVLLKVGSPSETRVFEDRNPALCLGATPDGKLLVVGFADNTVRVYRPVAK